MIYCSLVIATDDNRDVFETDLEALVENFDTNTARLPDGDYKAYIFECPDDQIDILKLAEEYSLQDVILSTTDYDSFFDIISVSGDYDAFHADGQIIVNLCDIYGIPLESVADDDFIDEDDDEEDDLEYL